MIGQVWEHWRTKNRLRIDSFEGYEDFVVRTTSDAGTTYSIDPEDLVRHYLYIGELEQ
jgi:hypothetical protein